MGFLNGVACIVITAFRRIRQIDGTWSH